MMPDDGILGIGRTRRTTLLSVPIRGIRSLSDVVRRLLTLAAICVVISHASAYSQPFTKKAGIGGMVGRTNGFTFKMYLAQNDLFDRIDGIKALDIALTWNFDDYLLWSGHIQTERPIPDSPLHFFVGPGFAMGFDKSELFWGPSMNIGVFFNRKRFEVFLQLTPRILILPNTSGDLGSAVGLRYFL